jgi:hypothetical protein
LSSQRTPEEFDNSYSTKMISGLYGAPFVSNNAVRGA